MNEIISGLRTEGWCVDLFEPSYKDAEPPGHVRRLIEFVRVQRRLAASLGDYDALYVRSHPLAFPVSRAAMRAGIPVIQECNGTYADVFLAWPIARWVAPLIRHAARIQYKWADALVAVTPQLGEWLRRETGHDNIRVIPNGANIDRFTPEAGQPPNSMRQYALFFGALAPWQGIDNCLEAATSERWPDDVMLAVAGDGLLRPQVIAAAQANPQRIAYLGRVKYADMPGLVAGSIASLIVKNEREHAKSGLSPLKLYESMACGVPVVVSDLPGLADIVEQQDCGIVVAPSDARALADAVARLAEDRMGAAHMGRRGRQYAEAYCSWSARAAETSELVAAILDMRSGMPICQ